MHFLAAASLVFAALVSSGVTALVLPSLLSRETSDICGNLDNAPLVITHPKVPLEVTVGKITACLCYSDTPAFISTNPLATTVVALVGELAATQAIMTTISGPGEGETCTYPDNAVPQCQSSNVCGFTCESGFEATPPEKPETCSCPSGNILCNGACVSLSSCPSSGQVVLHLQP